MKRCNSYCAEEVKDLVGSMTGMPVLNLAV